MAGVRVESLRPPIVFMSAAATGIHKKALRRPPLVHISTSRGVATINQSGIALLSQEGEKFVAVYRDADGQVVLQPIKVPPGTLFVREIERPAAGGGAPRIALKQLGLAKGNYRMKWMDLDGVAILEKE